MDQQQTKSKLNKIGAVWRKKDDSGFYIRLGNESKTKPEYNLSVEVIVRNAQGEVVAKQTDGFLTLLDPREQAEKFNNTKALEGLAKVPGLHFEIFAASENT
jgi:hypothetical protein